MHIVLSIDSTGPKWVLREGDMGACAASQKCGFTRHGLNILVLDL